VKFSEFLWKFHQREDENSLAFHIKMLLNQQMVFSNFNIFCYIYIPKKREQIIEALVDKESQCTQNELEIFKNYLSILNKLTQEIEYFKVFF